MPSMNVVKRTFTGYIDVGAKHLFFYFFESRNDPSKDDVLFWTNGGLSTYDLNISLIIFSTGPGGSSATALFMELGAHGFERWCTHY